MKTLATTLLLLTTTAPLAPAQEKKASEKVSYEQHVQPIVSQRCGRCHDEEKMKAGFVATTYAGVLAGSGSGAVVVAGEPEESILFLAITHRRDPSMPPGGNKIPQAEIDVIKKWIEGGLLENGGAKAKQKKKKSSGAPALVAVGKPAQPPPLPQDLVVEPVVTSARPGALESLAANPWAPLFAAGGQQQVLLYTLSSGAPELAGILPFPEGLPQCVQFSRDGKTLIASGGRGAALGRVVGWNVASGRRLFEVGSEDDAIIRPAVQSVSDLDVVGPISAEAAFTQPSGVYVKLHLGDPGEDSTANAAVETTRKVVTFAAAASGQKASNSQVQWTNVAATETYSHVSLWDAATAGNTLWSGALTSPVAVTATGTFTIASGALVMSIRVTWIVAERPLSQSA
jgi:mono/diheme cytochrome c family protein